MNEAVTVSVNQNHTPGVVVRVPDFGIARGEDGLSAYEQAVMGGYTGTEAQFNEELSSFKTLHDETVTNATAAAQSATGAGQSATAAAGSAESAASSATASASSASSASASAGSAADSASSAASSAASAAASAASAGISASTATEKAIEAASSATASSTSAASAAGSAGNAASSATAASASATAAGNAQTAAETAQGKAEDAQEAAEDAQEAAETAAQSVSQSAAQISQNTSDISDLKSEITILQPSASSSDVGKFLKAKTVSGGKVIEYEFGSDGGGSGLTSDIKSALMDLVEAVAYKTSIIGNQVYTELFEALYAEDVTSITAVFNQGYNFIHTGDSLDSLKQYLTVTVNYTGGDSQTTTRYTLSGTLTEGTSTITVSYAGKTTTFTVKVTKGLPSEYTKYDYIGSIAGTSGNFWPDYCLIMLKEYSDAKDYSWIVEFDYNTNVDSTGNAVFGGRAASGARGSLACYVKPGYAAIHCHDTDTGFLQSGVIQGKKNICVFTNTASSPSSYSVNGATPSEVVWGSNSIAHIIPTPCANRLGGIDNAIQPGGRCGELEFTDLQGNVVSHYIPCVRNADNVIGMYETIDDIFYTCSTPTYATIGNGNCKYGVGNWS